MQIAFTDHAWDDYLYWQTNDTDTLQKVNDLIREIKREPFKGTGKPEPLKGNLAGYWSRRITGEHRFVYRISGIKPNQIFTIIQLRFHY
ncbi:Txe/YoeB family addiction module toxin [Dawidia soli]|uniref:Putative mRNA interferase YoeB n=1 Tax=Dawidia soli TaxID=2782352 RepID=A0AAP2DA18_9BACT|nr:Txe/YoeB family addiction module toxin [Dawidia soli]MBT1688034.1 Txe/YoeB family addiction module toxin [Dawidia soli]